MQRAFLSATVLLFGSLGGCAQMLDFNECTSDDDCTQRLGADGGAVHCTSQHFCVAGLPPAVLCPEMAGVDAGVGTLVVVSVVNRSDPFDLDLEKSFRLAVDEINQYQVGDNQPPIALDICDSGGTSDQTLAAVTLAHDRDHAVAVLGPTSSDAVIAINSYVVANQMLVMSPSATAVSISSLADDNLVWRTAPSDELQARLLASLIAAATPAPTRVDTFYVDSIYGQGLSLAFQSEYIGISGPVWGKAFSFTQGGANLPAQLAKLGADKPSHAVLIADSDGPALFQQLAGVPGLTGTRFFATDSLMDDSIFGPTGHLVPTGVLSRVEGTAPATPSGQVYDAFKTDYQTRYNELPTSSFMANAYDAAYLIAIAAGATSGRVATGPDLASGLTLVKPQSQCPSVIQVEPSHYLAALQQIAKGNVCLDGASGPLVFDANGDPTQGSYEVWVIDTSQKPYQFEIVPQ